jgi:hypothetical protein
MALDDARRIEIEAVNPNDRTTPLIFTYSQKRLLYISRLGYRGYILESAHLVPFTLKYPSCIFRGLREDDDKYSGDSPGWLCYCSLPTQDFSKNGEPTNSKPNKVYVVFVNEDKIIFNWRWENADLEAYSNKIYVPENYKTRFKEKLQCR